MGRQRCPAARAVGHDFKPFVQQLPLPDFRQRPPFGLDIIIFIGDVRVIHIRPESDGAGEIFPHPLIFPDAFSALFDKGFDPVSLNLVFSIDPDRLLHFQLHRKPVGVPPRLPGHLVSLHGAVTGNHIFDGTGQNMSDMRLPVCGRRTVVEHVDLVPVPFFHTLVKNVLVLPELFNLLLAACKVHVCLHLVVHPSSLFSPFLPVCSDPVLCRSDSGSVPFRMRRFLVFHL